MKKKLRLQIETLRVEQFEVQPASATDRGTVHGHQTQLPDTCYCGAAGPSEPYRFCVEMPLTHSCDMSFCC